ncbi:hypothetical protein BHE74_00009913 [Ensete ventricosum]|nr:hypothetical protein GW17_00054439 [Ensete ventricosum]RWW81670.1 hypothetical protein BHE74_00009913 [Ensete ventricosum]RZR89333.1 hypothetical protein BHM03_00017029 [Ensete ventricosum]
MCRHAPTAPGGATRAHCPKKVPLFLPPYFAFVPPEQKKKIKEGILFVPARFPCRDFDLSRKVFRVFPGPFPIKPRPFDDPKFVRSFLFRIGVRLDLFGKFQGSRAGKSLIFVANWIFPICLFGECLRFVDRVVFNFARGFAAAEENLQWRSEK